MVHKTRASMREGLAREFEEAVAGNIGKKSTILKKVLAVVVFLVAVVMVSVVVLAVFELLATPKLMCGRQQQVGVFK